MGRSRSGFAVALALAVLAAACGSFAAEAPPVVTAETKGSTVMLDDVYRTYGPRGLVAVDVDPGETAADLAHFRELAGDPAYFWAMDEGQRLTRAYGVRFLDTTVIVDGTGELVFRSDGFPKVDTLRRAVQRALGL